MGLLVSIVIVFALLSAITGVPGYVLATRRGLKNPAVAFVPVLGLWIVAFESIDRSGWWVLIGFVPTVGSFALAFWTGFQAPVEHERSRLWSVVLCIPIVNIAGWWAYAFTLPKYSPDLVWESFA